MRALEAGELCLCLVSTLFDCVKLLCDSLCAKVIQPGKFPGIPLSIPCADKACTAWSCYEGRRALLELHCSVARVMKSKCNAVQCIAGHSDGVERG